MAVFVDHDCHSIRNRDTVNFSDKGLSLGFVVPNANRSAVVRLPLIADINVVTAGGELHSGTVPNATLLLPVQ